MIVLFARSYGLWLAAGIAVFVTADLANTYRVAIPGLGGPIVLMVLVFAASVHGGWRTKRMEGGLFAGVATALLFWLSMATWGMTTWYPFSLVQQTQPYWIQAWASSVQCLVRSNPLLD